MRLYLVRHGEALREPEELSPRGRAQADWLAEDLVRTGVQVAEIQHSGKARARETAERLALRIGARVSFLSGLKPDDDPALVGEILLAEEQDLMIVGHLPHLPRLAAWLVGGVSPRIELGNGDLLAFEREGTRWRRIDVLSPHD